MKVLIIEDNIKLVENIKTFLEMEGCYIDYASDGERGLYEASANMYDAVILDVNLPQMDGFLVCKKMRENNNNTPVIMLTSREKLTDKVKGLEDGADDYLTKPFEYEELLARLKALVRRDSSQKKTIIQIKNITINLKSKEIKKDDEVIDFSPLEISLLIYLVQNRGRVISRRELLEKVWGDFDAHAFSRTVDIYIGYLRKKCGANLIKTKKGFGYLIV